MPPFHSILLPERRAAGAPSWIAASLNSLETVHPGAALRLHDDDSLRSFIADRFDGDVAAAYDCAGPAGRSLLGRFCLLYEEGGVYSDPSLFYMAPAVASSQIDRLQLFRCAGGAGHGVSTALIAAPARLSLFERCIGCAIDLSARGAMEDGAQLFDSAVAATGEEVPIVWGTEIRLPGRSGVDRRGFVSAAGRFLALGQSSDAADGSEHAAALTGEEQVMSLLALLDGWL